MDFSFGNFFDDISTQCSFLLETVVTFTTPFFLRIFDFGIRTYLWIQNLPVFQVKRPYTDVLRNASWIYSGVLVHNTEYTMIHHYDIETKDIIEDISDKCCICLDDIIINQETKEEVIKNYNQLVELNTNKKKSNYMHNHCFLHYLKKEQKIRYVDDTTKKIECRCPFRNICNFRECYKEIKYI